MRESPSGFARDLFVAPVGAFAANDAQEHAVGDVVCGKGQILPGLDVTDLHDASFGVSASGEMVG